MSLDDDLNAVIESIYCAANLPDAWPAALRASGELFGGAGVTLEVIDKTAHNHEFYCSTGLPEAGEIEYLNHYVSVSPRLSLGQKSRTGDIGYDALVLPESGMAKDEFYSSFLTSLGLKYFVSGCLIQSPAQLAVVAIQFAPQHGHVEAAEISLMRHLLPHFRQAVDMSMRWQQLDRHNVDLEQALDQLRDGVIVLDGAGTVAHVNAEAQRIIRTGDGLTLFQHQLNLVDPVAMQSYETTLQNALLTPGEQNGAGFEIAVSRPSGKAPYVLAVRPFRDATSRAGAYVFIRDTAAESAHSSLLLRQAFGLTEAESELAEFLLEGLSLRQCADRRGVSINTVYTHYRRLKDKTGSAQQTALIAMLKDIASPIN